MRKYHWLALALLFSSLMTSGCLPTIKRQWDVQPVDGTLVDGVTGTPVAGAVITNADNPGLSATTDKDGYFAIEGQSHVGLHLIMAASAMRTQTWQIRHPDYAYAEIGTRTLIPPLSRQPSHLQLPLFTEQPSSPPDCPAYGYLMALAQWQDDNGIDEPWIETDRCHDEEAMQSLIDTWHPE